jgi:hypothetical protein
MTNPVEAFKDTKCEGCREVICQDEELYFTDDGKLCRDCAEDEDYVCACGAYKKSDYERCYKCFTNGR